MQAETYEVLLERKKKELQSLLSQFKQKITEREDQRAKESIDAFERDILERQERCTQEFDSEMMRFDELKKQNPKRVELYVRAEQSTRRQYLSSMTFLCDVLRDKIAQS